MTQEQFEALKPFEDNFTRAVYNNYFRRICRADLRILYGIYNDITGENKPVPNGCSNCIIDVVKRMGRMYFEYKEEVGKKSEEVIEVKEEKSTEVVAEMPVISETEILSEPSENSEQVEEKPKKKKRKTA